MRTTFEKDRHQKAWQWPNGARLAFSLVVNVEEGAEGRTSDGDKYPESVDELGISLRGGQQNLANESNYQYGLIEGAPRVLNLLAERQLNATFTCAAVALERSPQLANAIVEAGHEVCAHGYRWVHQFKLDEEKERDFIRSAADTIEIATGARPHGWLSRYLFTENTRRLLVEEGYRYHMDDYSRDEPFWDVTDSGSIVIVPYALDTNDMKMWTAPAWSPEQWLDYALDTLRTLYDEGEHAPRMMSLGIHLRVIGRPGRIRMLSRFLDRLQEYEDVWFATRSEIAQHFSASVKDPTGPRSNLVIPPFESNDQKSTDPDLALPANRQTEEVPVETNVLMHDDSDPPVKSVAKQATLRVDNQGLLNEFPIGSDFVSTFSKLSRDELFHRQGESFSRVLRRAWEVPFYQRLWSAAGIEAGDIKGIEQLDQLPVFDKKDLMRSIEDYPPWGDYHGVEDFADGERAPVIMHTTSGTTGKPQVIPFGPRSRAVQNLLLARTYLLQGLQPQDVAQSVYGHGLVNGGHYIREAVTQWTGTRLLSAGTGLETPSERQIQLMSDFDVTVLLGFPDYLMKLADTAKRLGKEPSEFSVRMISGHLGSVSRDTLSEAWNGASVFDWYGVGDTGVIAGEGPDQDGLYVMEDAHYLELLDMKEVQPVNAGESGDMVVTCLFKDDIYPIIRFNTHDVSAVLQGQSSLGLSLRRLQGFLGRSDNMVKIKGVNIFPDSIGSILGQEPNLTGEYQCILTADSDGNDKLTVLIESNQTDESERLILLNLLRQRLGVSVEVDLQRPGSLAADTQVEARQKPIRFIDKRS